MVDSTGLKVFGEGGWLENKHKSRARRKRWRKLHLGLDLVIGEIVCSDLTADDVGDPAALPDLLDQIGGPVDTFIAAGAYDGAPTRDLLAERFGEIVKIIIPPKTAVPSPQSVLAPSVRDRHVAAIWCILVVVHARCSHRLGGLGLWGRTLGRLVISLQIQISLGRGRAIRSFCDLAGAGFSASVHVKMRCDPVGEIVELKD
ncbi:transposase [Rhizobium tubonense]|uniref:transposase n=1 Tax=Rhizobium tubonense TaxID=484088 RepID=UPI001FCEB63F|nr:transposase [Rhizobium tubonense]